MLTDPWRARRLAAMALFVSLWPLPAAADGISGGLAAMRALALAALGVFAAAWIAVWLTWRAMKRSRAKTAEPSAKLPSEPTPRRYWLFDPSIPVGLRILALAQYLLAPVYGFNALIRSMFPAHYLNGRIHPEVVQLILFSVLFCVLALVSAGGYLNRRDRTAFRRGVALGWLCVGNGVLFILLHSHHSMEFDSFSPLFGGLLLVLLYTRYRGYFESAAAAAPVSPTAAPQ